MNDAATTLARPTARISGQWEDLAPWPLSAEERAAELAARREVEQVAADFEAFFRQMLMKAQRQTLEKSELFSGGMAEDIASSLLDQRLCELSAGREGGVSRMVRESLISGLDGVAHGALRQTLRKAYGLKP